MLAFAALIGGFPAVAAASPVTLYVAGSGGVDLGAGADSGDCQTESTPCLSLAYAVGQAAPGDTVEISGTLSDDSSVALNEAMTLAANPDASDATIQGSGDADGLLLVNDAVTLRGLTLEDGYSSGSGGGAITVGAGADVTIIDSTLADNTADYDGGAIDNGGWATPGGTVTIIDSTLTGNAAGGDGGAIDNADWGASDDTVTISGSTLTGNTAGMDGGAIDNTDEYGSDGSVTITDTTLSDNLAMFDGGAIDNNDFAGSGGTVTIADSTLNDDTSFQHGQEIDAVGYGGGVYMAADVINGSCFEANNFINDDGYNAATDSSCLGSTVAGSDSLSPDAADFGPLEANGGPTQTSLLTEGNPALGLIPHGTSVSTGPGGSVTVACPATDQRGITSAPGAACDAGAVQQTAQTTYASGTSGDYAGAASDANDCSDASTPCTTVQAAIGQLAPGGTVKLSGTFSQSQAVNVGTSALIETNPIDAGSAVIDGNTDDTSGLMDVIGTGAAITVRRLTLENGYNTASYGGGAITHNVGGLLAVEDSTLSDNTAENGGAIDNNDATSGASLTVTDSTLTGNSAPDGGAIDNNDNNANGGSVAIADSTLTGNSAADGGAIDTDDNNGGGGSLTVTDSTLGANSDSQLGQEIGNSHYASGGSVWVAGDVFAGACTDDSGGSGIWTDAGYNAATDSSCLGSGPVGSDATPDSAAASLDALTDNGGNTPTQALGSDNPAIALIPTSTSVTTGPSNAVTLACPVTADQRDITSINGVACDAGAVQYQDQTLTFAAGLASAAVVDQAGATASASSTSGLAPSLNVDRAQTTNGACTLSGGLVAFAHAGACVIDATQSGDPNFAASNISHTITVSAATTHTVLSASGNALTATVNAVAPGGGTPTGTVQFVVGGQTIGTANLSDGRASLTETVPANTSQQVTAAYQGTDDYGASHSVTLSVAGPTTPTPTPTTTPTPTSTTPAPATKPTHRLKPSITARLSSSRPRSSAGWWTAPVKVSFSCRAHGAKLSHCPRPFTITKSGKGMRATGRLTTSTGQTARVVIHGINIDLTRPAVRIVKSGPQRADLLQATTARCHATDQISGVRSCRLNVRTMHIPGGLEILYTARTTSNAGTVTSRTARVHISFITLIGAKRSSHSSYAVIPGRNYVLQVLSRTLPSYLNAAPSPLRPTPPHAYFARVGTVDGIPCWRVTIRITHGFARFPAWTIGVRMGGDTSLLRLLT